jgi:hypothetical protein
MNTLYIGPYKNNNVLSISSLDIIDCLNNSSKIESLSIRPIYVNNNQNNHKSLIISNLERTKYVESYDIVIQHGPVQLLLDHLPISSKNIAIPLVDKIYNRNRYFESLANFDLILVDTEEYYNFLTSGYGFKNVKIFDYYGLYHNTKTLDFSTCRSDKKIYYIGLYDSALIDKIVRAFYLATTGIDNVSLMLFINQPPDTIPEDFNKKIQEIQKSLNINSVNDNINLFFKYFDTDEIISMHNSCDIYVDLCNYNTDSGFNRYLAKNKNKTIIDRTKLDTYNEFAFHNNGYIYPEIIQDFSCFSLAKVLGDALASENEHKYPKYPNIAEIVCQ